MREPSVLADVVEALPNLLYKVKLVDSDTEVLAYISGKMKVNKIKVLIGDKVEVILDPYKGKGTNRIIRRL
jgi:translation initiation factor IF-1